MPQQAQELRPPPTDAGVSSSEDRNDKLSADTSKQAQNPYADPEDVGTAPVRKSDDTQESALEPGRLANLHPEKWQALLSHGASPALAQAILSDPQFGMASEDEATPASAAKVPEMRTDTKEENNQQTQAPTHIDDSRGELRSSNDDPEREATHEIITPQVESTEKEENIATGKRQISAGIFRIKGIGGKDLQPQLDKETEPIVKNHQTEYERPLTNPRKKADEYNRKIINLATKQGRDLTPTIENAARLKLKHFMRDPITGDIRLETAKTSNSENIPYTAQPALLQIQPLSSIPDTANAADSIEDFIYNTRGSAGYSVTSAYDALRRVNYKKAIEANSGRFISQIKELSPTQLAEAEIIARNAFDTRKNLRTATQNLLSPGGRLTSKAIEKPNNFEQQLSSRFAKALKEGEKINQMEAYNRAIKSAGTSNGFVSGVSTFTKYAGPIGTIAGLGMSGVTVYDAPSSQKGLVAAQEAGGFLGE